MKWARCCPWCRSLIATLLANPGGWLVDCRGSWDSMFEETRTVGVWCQQAVAMLPRFEAIEVETIWVETIQAELIWVERTDSSFRGWLTASLAPQQVARRTGFDCPPISIVRRNWVVPGGWGQPTNRLDSDPSATLAVSRQSPHPAVNASFDWCPAWSAAGAGSSSRA